MSNLVTYEQEQILERIGFSFKKKTIDCVDDLGRWCKDEKNISPTVSDALQWLRENKAVVCYVDVIYHPIEKKAMYLGKILSESGLIIQMKTDEFDTHPLAETALLTAVLNHLNSKTV